MKKILSLLLALALLLSLSFTVAAEDVPTLELLLWDTPVPDTDLVSEALSKLTVDKIGAKVHITIVNDQKQWPLMLASNEPIDVIFVSNGIGYRDLAVDGAFLDIKDMLPTVTPALYATLTEAHLAAADVNGGIYCVPSYKDMCCRIGIWMEKKMADAFNINTTLTYSLTDIEPWLEYIHNDPEHVDSTLMVFGTNFNWPRLGMSNDYYYFDDISGYSFGAPKNDTSKIECIYMSDAYEAYCKLMYSWYEKGYIRQDVATIDNWVAYYQNGSGVGYGIKMGQYNPYAELSQSATYGGELVFINIGENVMGKNDVLGACWAVPAKSKNSELALKLIELLDTDTAVQNTVAFGVEGVHYNMVDGKIQLVEGYADHYKTQDYKAGDVRVRGLLVGEADDKAAKFEELNNSAVVSPFMGFQPDLSGITNENAAVYAVVQEYAKLLGNGAADPAEYLPMFQEALKEAGVDTITETVQAQYDEFLSKK